MVTDMTFGSKGALKIKRPAIVTPILTPDRKREASEEDLILMKTVIKVMTLSSDALPQKIRSRRDFSSASFLNFRLSACHLNRHGSHKYKLKL